MSIPLNDLAIQYALQNNWQKACEVNLQILEENSEDLDTLNRLAFSYMKLGKFKQAKSTYKKVIDLDKTNPIALKNLKKLETISTQDFTPPPQIQDDATNNANLYTFQDMFIEEAGKTKTVELKNVADKKALSHLQPGEHVKIVIKRSKIFIQSLDDKFIGMLPDSMGIRLITFIKGGNEYEAFIKAIDEKMVMVFLKETKRSSKFKNQPSFTSTYAHLSTDSI